MNSLQLQVSLFWFTVSKASVDVFLAASLEQNITDRRGEEEVLTSLWTGSREKRKGLGARYNFQRQ